MLEKCEKSHISHWKNVICFVIITIFVNDKNSNPMELRRDIIEKLPEWKKSTDRKPLIISGARQIGKTWLMKHFGKEYFKHTAYFNFDNSEELCREFENTKDPERLIGILGLYADCPITPGETLIIFDEIQQSNRALNSLKYFCEDAPEYCIIAAGSLLGVALSHGESFPVGKVDFLQMYPVTFKEFLRVDDPKCHDYLDGLGSIETLPEIIMNRATESYRRYMTCGGMPGAAVAMLENHGTGAVEKEQANILQAYTLDFAKHAPTREIPRITSIWNSIPSQLARENRKFVYKLVKPGARSREYEDALLWLQQAGLIYRVFCLSKPGLPLSAYDDVSSFKIYTCDTGLLRSLAALPPDIFWTSNPLYQEFQGALTENAILQALLPDFNPMPRYWTSNGTAEVDFIVQDGLDVIPIEVKSGTNTSGKSLSVYVKKYAPQLSIIYSRNNLRLADSIIHIPLFLADWTKKLIRIANGG